MKNNSLIIGVIIIIVILLVLMVVIVKSSREKSDANMLNINYRISGNEASFDQYETENPVVALYIENYGSVVIELYPDVAPNTVNNFIYLVKSGFYDNNTFHRLMKGFVLQGGDPTGSGSGGPDYRIAGEFSNNGFENNLNHTKGVVSMARGTAYDTAGSQFFIVLEDTDYLDGNYAAFGKVIDGFENVERIAANEEVLEGTNGSLAHNLVLKKALVDLKGKTYSNPVIVQ